MKPHVRSLTRPAAALLVLTGLLAAPAAFVRAHEDEKPKSGATTAAATTYVCPMHPDVTDTKAGATCPKCGMKLVAKAAPKADAMDHEHGGMDMTAPHTPTAPTIKTAILTAEPPAAGRGVAAIAKLTRPDGQPLTYKDLNEAHTKRIHLLIVDDSLTDYHHEHPKETQTPGDFAFSFQPRNGGRYTVWADVVPTATGNQEYSRAEVTVPGTPAPKASTLNRTTTVDGYRFDLTTENNEGFTAGKATLVKVLVTDLKGQPVKVLEPVMGAYAHGVGFPADLSEVTHVHPMGEEPTKDSERGGPELSFHLLPEKPGFLKFYVQVQLDGKDVFAGFGLDVAPAPDGTAKN